MEKKQLTIDDLLTALKNPNTIDKDIRAVVKGLENTKEIWERIGRKDSSLATDLGIEQSELNDFLKEWTSENPYNAIT